jgi:uncharacterized membrane protein
VAVAQPFATAILPTGGNFFTFADAFAISRDGSTVVGEMSSVAGPDGEAYRLNTTTGVVTVLGSLSSSTTRSRASAVNFDGTVAGGMTRTTSSFNLPGAAFSNGSVFQLPDVASGAVLAEALDCTNNGTTFVGFGSVNRNNISFTVSVFWGFNPSSGSVSGPVEIALPSGAARSRATAVDSSGVFMAGWYQRDLGAGQSAVPTGWFSNNNGASGFEIPGLTVPANSVVEGMNATAGSVVVGRSFDGANGLPVKWTRSGSTLTIAALALPAGMVGGTAFDVSDDGSVIVGEVTDGLSFFAAIWRGTNVELLQNAIVAGNGTITAGMTLTSASSVSGDGRFVAGEADLVNGLEVDDVAFYGFLPPSCPADVGSQGGIAGADGQLNNNDFAAFITLFFAQNPRADVGAQGGIPGSDGAFDNNDFAAFITLFFAGC